VSTISARLCRACYLLANLGGVNYFFRPANTIVAGQRALCPMATATRLTPILVVLPRPSSGRVSVILAPSSKGLRFFGTSIRRKLGTRAMRTSLSLTPKERRSMESAAPMGTRPEYRLGQLSILRYNPISWRYESENASTRRYRPSDKLKPYRAPWPLVTLYRQRAVRGGDRYSGTAGHGLSCWSKVAKGGCSGKEQALSCVIDDILYRFLLRTKPKWH
jgi:hypothetical protein